MGSGWLLIACCMFGLGVEVDTANGRWSKYRSVRAVRGDVLAHSKCRATSSDSQLLQPQFDCPGDAESVGLRDHPLAVV